MSVSGTIKLFFQKIIRILGRAVYRKHVWLISDRSWAAGDNGEAFFRYIQDKTVNSVFAVSKKSSDYEVMKAVGNVVDYDSLAYRFLLCVADVHISSHENHMAGHRETPQIFLSHGISYRDIHDYFNSFWHENVHIIAASRDEADTLLNPKCKFKPEQILLEGYPRFDRLDNDETEKIITIAFTWRRDLWNASEEKFFASDYYKVYASFFECKDLLDKITKAGYSVRLKLHPQVAKFKASFSLPESVSFWAESSTYNDVFRKSSLIITDYSSVIYDFVYLNKPIIYYQPDFDVLIKENPEEYGFDFIGKGMGDVTRTQEELKMCLEDYLKNDCQIKDLYQERVRNFFEFQDKDNSKRVYNAVKSIVAKKD